MSPINYKNYHPEWKSIVRQIKDQAGDRCEFCGVANGSVGARDRHGDWHDEEDIDGMNSSVGEDVFGVYPNSIRIVLTVAHLNHDTTDNDPANLKALCQRCHLSWDRERHTAKAAQTRAMKTANRLAKTGQLAFLATGG